MNHMDFSISMMVARCNDALFALITIIGIQALMIILMVATKKTMPARPVLEVLFRPFIIKIIDKLNRAGRSDFALIIRGSIVFFLILLCVSVIGIAVETIMAYSGYGLYMDVVLMAMIISPLAIIYPVYSVSSEKPADGAFRAVTQTLNQNLIKSDKHALRRAGIKALSISILDWMVAPILFYILFCVPVAYLYISLSLFVRISGRQNGTFLSMYGVVYRVMKSIASVFAVITIGLAAIFSAGGKPFKIINIAKFKGHVVEAAFAVTQNITLGGAYQNRYGDAIKSPWIGLDGSTAKLSHKDVLRVIIHYSITLFLFSVALFAIYSFA